jgi:hypothetical protein
VIERDIAVQLDDDRRFFAQALESAALEVWIPWLHAAIDRGMK